MYNRSNYAPTGKGFSGIRICDLIQKPDFYKSRRDSTMKYLLRVYPTAKESFKEIGDLELASFYNSLSYYYNCNFLESGCKEDSPLPYPPQGWFFNNWTYQNFGQPIIFSDSDEKKEELSLKNFSSGQAGLAFFDPRTIQRNIWFPNGISMTNKDGKEYWNYVSGQKITWNYPKKWWKGLKNNSYIEITHTAPNPSLVQSPGWWWNAVTGSGIFLNLGKTLGVNNKLEGVYKLLKKMNKDFLMTWYSSDDIYQIIYGLIGMCSSNFCNNLYTDCLEGCKVETDGVLKKSNLPLQNFYNEVIRYQKEFGISQQDIPTKEGIISSINSAINNSDYRLSRVSGKLVLDETLFFLGLNAGYDTIQFTTDPNNNGFFVFEILDLRIPEKYIKDAKERKYTFIEISDRPEDNSYLTGFAKGWMDKFVEEGVISVRDPLDIYNEKKVKKCLTSSSNNFYCEGIMSERFR